MSDEMEKEIENAPEKEVENPEVKPGDMPPALDFSKVEEMISELAESMKAIALKVDAVINLAAQNGDVAPISDDDSSVVEVDIETPDEDLDWN